MLECEGQRDDEVEGVDQVVGVAGGHNISLISTRSGAVLSIGHGANLGLGAVGMEQAHTPTVIEGAIVATGGGNVETHSSTTWYCINT